MKELVQLNVRVKPSMRKALKVLALSRGMPLEDFVNSILADYIKKVSK